MLYCVYHKETTRFLCNHSGVKTDHSGFRSEAAARAALTREVKRGAVRREDFAITDGDNFYANVQKQVTKRNLMSGQEFQQPVNTPMICDPSTETYWSM